MSHRLAFLLALVLFGTVASSAAAQEVLRPAKIQARASRRQPSLGLPRRLDGQTDPAVWFETGAWMRDLTGRLTTTGKRTGGR